MTRVPPLVSAPGRSSIIDLDLLPPEAARILSDWLAVNVPQVLPSGYPHNLPPRRELATFRPFSGLDGEAGAPGAGAGVVNLDFFDRHHYAELIEGNMAIGLASSQVLTQPANRRNFLALRNASTGTEVIFVAFGSPANTGSWLRLEPDQIVLFDVVVPQNDMYAICDAATGQLSYAFATVNY